MFLRIVALVIPGLLMAAGAALLIGFPITRRRQAAIRRRLESRRRDPAHPAVA
jgi:Na+/melibiose symporter-like transporter